MTKIKACWKECPDVCFFEYDTISLDDEETWSKLAQALGTTLVVHFGENPEKFEIHYGSWPYSMLKPDEEGEVVTDLVYSGHDDVHGFDWRAELAAYDEDDPVTDVQWTLCFDLRKDGEQRLLFSYTYDGDKEWKEILGECMTLYELTLLGESPYEQFADKEGRPLTWENAEPPPTEEERKEVVVYQAGISFGWGDTETVRLCNLEDAREVYKNFLRRKGSDRRKGRVWISRFIYSDGDLVDEDLVCEREDEGVWDENEEKERKEDRG